MLDDLTALAIFHGTDKFGIHNYSPIYWRLFKDLRDKPIKILEIGVGGYDSPDRGGESLAVWRDFFPNGTIVGVDIFEKRLPLGDRVHVLQGSQVDAVFLAGVLARFGPFDIIIDDGSHMNKDVVVSFEMLFPFLADDGIYVVEDTQTAFFPYFGGSPDPRAETMISYFADLFRQMDHAEVLSVHATHPINPHVRSIASIERLHNLIVVRKGDNTYPSNFTFDIGNGEVQRSIAAIETVLARRPTEGAHALLVDMYITGRDFARAEWALARMASAGFASYPFYYMTTKLLPLVADWEASFRIAEIAANTAADKADFYRFLAEFFTGRQDWDRAQEARNRSAAASAAAAATV